jgi:Domain of unknown function (DUF1877)
MDAYYIKVDPEQVNDKDALERLIEESSRDATLGLSLGDSWAAIHLVLTGTPFIPKFEAKKRGISWDDQSLENVIMGGEATPVKDAFGAARYLSPRDIDFLAQRLAAISDEEFKNNYDADELEDYQIPPGDWDDEALQWLLRNFHDLKAYFESAAKENKGLLTYVV